MANGVNDERHTYAYRQMVKHLKASPNGGTCHICTLPIDRGIKSPDPQSWSADHIVPLANGGLSVLSNLAPAHRGCNSRKGNAVAKPGSTVNGVVQTWRATRDW